MNRQFKRRFSILLLLCAVLTGCEKPQQRSVVQEKEPVPQAPASTSVEEVVPVPSPASPPTPSESQPMEEPFLKIWMVDKKITITGRMKSRLQVDRIVTTMKEAFPEHEIVNELLVEAHRYPVGWGNRLADEFLVPYFKEVKSPGVAYQTGVVTLLGEVENGGRLQSLTEIAVITFSGELTQDIDNKLTTAK
jgi:hypothetical protein